MFLKKRYQVEVSEEHDGKPGRGSKDSTVKQSLGATGRSVSSHHCLLNSHVSRPEIITGDKVASSPRVTMTMTLDQSGGGGTRYRGAGWQRRANRNAGLIAPPSWAAEPPPEGELRMLTGTYTPQPASDPPRAVKAGGLRWTGMHTTPPDSCVALLPGQLHPLGRIKA